MIARTPGERTFSASAKFLRHDLRGSHCSLLTRLLLALERWDLHFMAGLNWMTATALSVLASKPECLSFLHRNTVATLSFESHL